MAALIGEVAIETMLDREMLLDALPDLDARLEHTVSGEQEARATLALIDDSTSEVISVEVFPVPLKLEFINIEVSKGRFQELFGESVRLLKVFRSISKRLLGFFRRRRLSFLTGVGVGVSMSMGARLSKDLSEIIFAISVSRPANVRVVD